MIAHGLNSKEVLSIIPARGGSKRLPKKNIKTLGDKPLIGWTIEASLRSPSITRTVVSTDSEEIADVALQCGAEVPILRPKNLALDEVHAFFPTRAMLEYLRKEEHYEPDIVVMLLPTSPLRRTKDIEGAVQKLIKSGADSVISVCKMCPVHSIRKIDDRGYLRSITHIPNLNFQSQDTEESYMVNGSIYVSTAGTLYRYGTFHAPNSMAYVMEKRHSVDINTEEDFNIASKMLGCG